MPQVEWSEKNMRYAICFFPLIGLVIGALEWCVLYVTGLFEMGDLFRTSLMTAVPFLVTGGIHMDGFSDTSDARHSYQSRERKLEIMKDPHVGSFAVFCCIFYTVLYAGALSEVKLTDAFLLAGTFLLSRIFSGIAVTTFPKAKKDGMLRSTADATAKSVKWILIAELVLVTAVLLMLDPVSGGIEAAAGLLFFAYYHRLAIREFGGITGDLAGWFVQMTELILVFVIVLVRLVSGL